MTLQTIFDQPQAQLLPDSLGARYYANVSNALEVAIGSRVYAVPLAIPSELFTLFREVCKFNKDVEITLALDLIDERYIFSATQGASIFDLWSYSERSLPGWITNSAYRLAL